MTCIHSTTQTIQNSQETNADTDNHSSSLPTRSPQSALLKTQEGFELTIDLPGASADDIQVEMKGNRLYLKASTDQGFKYRRTYTFKNSFSWGEFEAKWTSGRLKLILPVQKPLGQIISIKSA